MAGARSLLLNKNMKKSVPDASGLVNLVVEPVDLLGGHQCDVCPWAMTRATASATAAGSAVQK